MERFKPTQILSERASVRFGMSLYPTHLISLVALCGIENDQAAGLVWGDPTHLTSRQLDKLSNVFDLDRDLLACLFTPISSEGLRHTVQTKTSALTSSCHECAMIEEAHLAGSDVMFAMLHHLGSEQCCSRSLPVEMASMRVINLLELTGPVSIRDVSDICQVEEEAILWLGRKVADISGDENDFKFDPETGLIALNIEMRQV